ncbi:MAG: hypothetical protein LC109_12465 [Bacteroidia bacterium]|nr:hypothetical protein [Bacteroidia bacterium]
MKILAPIPVYGRYPLVRHTVGRLQGMGVEVVCMGDSDAREYCPCEFVEVENSPLGRKWNAGFKWGLEKYDAYLFVGSSDWVSEGWVKEMFEHLWVYDIVGVRGFHMADIREEIRCCYWGGYEGARSGESIGIGRMIRGELVDYMNGDIFNPTWNNSMDYSMIERAQVIGAMIKTVETKEVNLSISTGKWDNKHKFEDHWSGKLKSERTDSAEMILRFPELKILQEELYGRTD